MSAIYDTFERCFCINLRRRPKKRQRFLEDFPDRAWPFRQVEMVDAIDGNLVEPPHWWHPEEGAWGCYRSHLRLIEQCLNDDVDSVLLLEDDAVFPDNFTQRATAFINALPRDWGMIYLGGEHIHTAHGLPEKVNDLVYRPYNVNRTHAFALRGSMMRKVYQHLTRVDWKPGHHIDHWLGKLHEKRADPIYCPDAWMVGQLGGFSDIDSKAKPTKYWEPASEVAKIDTTKLPFVAVLGLHSSGSSALAGVLWHLGVHLGHDLVGYYGNVPGGKCGYEDRALMRICEDAIRFPATKLMQSRGTLLRALRDWTWSLKQEAAKLRTIAGGKYPQLCQLGTQLTSVNGDSLRAIDCQRPIAESIESIVQRTDGDFDPAQVEAHQRWLQDGKLDLLSRLPRTVQLRVDYESLVDRPQRQVERIIEFLGLHPSEEQIEAAIGSVKPELRHVTEAVACD